MLETESKNTQVTKTTKLRVTFLSKFVMLNCKKSRFMKEHAGKGMFSMIGKISPIGPLLK